MKKNLIRFLVLFYIIFLGLNFLKWLNQPTEKGRHQEQVILGTIYQSLLAFQVHNGHYPPTKYGLESLLEKLPLDNSKWDGPYINESRLEDSWRNRVRYLRLNKNEIVLISPGKDRRICTDDDYLYPEDQDEFWRNFCRIDYTTNPQNQKLSYHFLRVIGFLFALHGYHPE